MRRTACLLFAVVGAVLCLLDVPAARADVYDDNPATAARSSNELWVFARAGDGTILARARIGGEWGNWTSLGGTATSGPTAMAYGDLILVFVRGADGGIYQKTLDVRNQWTDWVALGGYATSAPSAIQRRGAAGYIDLTFKGGDNAIWLRTWVPGTGWSAAGSIAGNLTSAPTMSSQSADILNIWARGTDGAVYQRSWNGAAWAEWASLGGGIIGAPSAVSRTENVVNVYARGGGNALYARSWVPTGWSEWFLLDDAPIDSSPVAGGDGPDHEWVVARSRNELVIKEWRSPRGWAVWQNLGTIALPAPPPPPPGPPASAPLPVGQVDLKTGVTCTPADGKLRVSVAVKKPKGKNKPRVTKIVFFTKGKGRRVRTDRKAPFQVHLKINRPAGSTGRVYARVYYKRTAGGKTYRKVVSRRYKVCR